MLDGFRAMLYRGRIKRTAGRGNAMRNWIEFALLKTVRKIFAVAVSRVVCLWLPVQQRTGIRVVPDYVRSRYGVLLKGNWRDRTFQYCLFGTYGGRLARLLRKQERPFIFLDIGANQGLYSLIAAGNRACRQVIALEPAASTHGLLTANIAANPGADKVTAIKAGLSEQRGAAFLSLASGHSGMASLRPGYTAKAAVQEEVELIDMAQLDEMLAADLPVIVKVDVEGHEEAVMRSLAQSRHIQRMSAVFYEVDCNWSDEASLKTILGLAGFKGFTRYGRGAHFDVLATQ
jgi:FkbM family methyltransferase